MSRWKVRMFEVGEICVHKGYICRVDASERCIVGVTRSSSYAIEDGTELNPTLTLTPLYGPDGEPAKNAKSRKAVSGAVEYVHDVLAEMERRIAVYEKRHEPVSQVPLVHVGTDGCAIALHHNLVGPQRIADEIANGDVHI